MYTVCCILDWDFDFISVFVWYVGDIEPDLYELPGVLRLKPKNKNNLDDFRKTFALLGYFFILFF